jgi:predicted RNA binding protein YcfA (HicA-like mRNA interferase family)
MPYSRYIRYSRIANVRWWRQTHGIKGAMPRKLRDLIKDLEAAGFINRGGKGSHRNFAHPKVAKIVTLSGNPGDDVKHYQERAVKTAIEESRK